MLVLSVFPFPNTRPPPDLKSCLSSPPIPCEEKARNVSHNALTLEPTNLFIKLPPHFACWPNQCRLFSTGLPNWVQTLNFLCLKFSKLSFSVCVHVCKFHTLNNDFYRKAYEVCPSCTHISIHIHKHTEAWRVPLRYSLCVKILYVGAVPPRAVCTDSYWVTVDSRNITHISSQLLPHSGWERSHFWWGCC